MGHQFVVVRQIIGDGQTLKSAVILKRFSPNDEKGFVCATVRSDSSARGNVRRSLQILLQEILDGCEDTWGIQAVLSKNLKCWSGLAISVLDADNLDRNRSILGKSLADRTA